MAIRSSGRGCRTAIRSAAATPAPARRVPARTTWMRARSTSIVAVSADTAMTTPLAASERAGCTVPANGSAAAMAPAAMAIAANGQTISATRSSGP